MKFSSIFYSITFIFILSASTMFVAFSWIIDYDKENYTRELNTKYSVVSRATLMHLNGLLSDLEYEDQIKNFKMPEIKIGTNEVLKKAHIIEEIKSDIGSSSILLYNNKHYLRLDFDDKTYLLLDDTYEPYRYTIIQTILWFVLAILLATYIFVIRKIKPLRKLKRQIDKFAKGDLDIIDVSTGNDEISDVASAFYKAVTQIKLLNNSRQLFLRNIMHELKTPITKGRIAAEFIEKGKNKTRLISAFERLESLINEFAAVERATNGFINLNSKNCTIEDVIDEALDLAMVESNQIDIQMEDNFNIKADFKLLSIAFKNIIDNGIKYSDDNSIKIIANKEKIEFISKGEGLKHNLEYYSKPFTQGQNAKKSFGLGLYIVDNILKAHNFDFKYSRKKDKNIFYIIYN